MRNATHYAYDALATRARVTLPDCHLPTTTTTTPQPDRAQDYTASGASCAPPAPSTTPRTGHLRHRRPRLHHHWTRDALAPSFPNEPVRRSASIVSPFGNDPAGPDPVHDGRGNAFRTTFKPGGSADAHRTVHHRPRTRATGPGPPATDNFTRTRGRCPRRSHTTPPTTPAAPAHRSPVLARYAGHHLPAPSPTG